MEKLTALEKIIRQFYAVDELQGYTEGEIDFLKELFGALPWVLENFYRVAGNTEAIHHVQDSWMRPENFRKWAWLQTSDHMILLNENQGVCRAGIRRKDLILPDPPVYSTADDKTWVICAPTTSEFLAAALAYESAFTFSYNPEEFYWLTDEEMELIQAGRLEPMILLHPHLRIFLILTPKYKEDENIWIKILNNQLQDCRR